MIQMSRTSRWAGYVASVFAIALYVVVTAFYRSGQTLMNWWPLITVMCMMLAAFSGVVCLRLRTIQFFPGQAAGPARRLGACTPVISFRLLSVQP